VNVTPANSGTASAHSAAPLQPGNSSLADFLLAGLPANSGEDFRAIAAALFGVESASAGPTQTLAQKPAAVKKPVDGPQHENESRKGKESADPGSPAPHSELPLPVPLTPLDFALKPEPTTSSVSLTDIKAVLKEPAMFAGRNLSDSSEKLADAVSSPRSAPSETLKATPPPSSLTDADKPAPIVIMSDVERKLPPFVGDPPHWPPAPPDGLMRAKEPAARSAATPASGTTAKKIADDGSNQLPSTETAKQASTAAANPSPPARPTAAPVAVNPGPEMSAAASLPSAAPVELTSAVSASEISDTLKTARPAPASGPVDPRLAAGLSNESLRPAPAASPTIKGRELTDRGIKDTRTTSTQRGKISSAEAGNFADGLTKSAVTSIKDVGGVTLGAHPDAHAKPIPLKQAALTPSSQTAVADADGPDESLPTSTPSPITTAKLVQSMSQSEFRVGMQTQEFGNIDIRTSVARHMFSAQISVEHSDVAKSMTADLPALYHKLADQQVPVASIVIQGQSFATSSGLAQDSQQPQTWRPQSYNATKSDAETALPGLMETLDSAGRLDIRI
jgi:flagellar hook-length control protein FliK